MSRMSELDLAVAAAVGIDWTTEAEARTAYRDRTGKGIMMDRLLESINRLQRSGWIERSDDGGIRLSRRGCSALTEASRQLVVDTGEIATLMGVPVERRR